LWLRPARPGTAWLRPIDLVSGIGAVSAVVVAASGWPMRAPLVGALLVAAAIAAAIGVPRRLALLESAVPVLVCAAWVVGVIDTARGHALWFTVPISLALFSITTIGRRAHRRLGGRGTPSGFVAIEVAGYVALVLPPLVDLVHGSLEYGAVAIAFGVGLSIWGVISEVRRRLVAGVATVVVAVVLLIGVPLVDRVSGARPSSMAIWLGILIVGVIAITVASALERGRAVIRTSMGRIADLTSDWE
jgi:hypothetical protein